MTENAKAAARRLAKKHGRTFHVVRDDSTPAGKYGDLRVCDEEGLQTFYSGLTPLYSSDED